MRGVIRLEKILALPSMAAWGQSRLKSDVCITSAFPLIATESRTSHHRFARVHEKMKRMAISGQAAFTGSPCSLALMTNSSA